MSFRDRVAVATYRALVRSRVLRTSLGAAAYRAGYDVYKSMTDTHIVALCQRNAKPGDHAVDVGAYIGFHTVRLADCVGPTGRVVSFEPEESAARRLRSRIERAGLTQVVVREVAVTDRAGPLELRLGRSPTDSRVHPHPSSVSSYMVHGATLDDELSELGVVPSLVKIDVQGHEVRVLRGMQRTLAAPWSGPIILEYWPEGIMAAGDDPEEVFAITARHGWRAALISRAGMARTADRAAIDAAIRSDVYIDLAFVRERGVPS